MNKKIRRLGLVFAVALASFSVLLGSARTLMATPETPAINFCPSGSGQFTDISTDLQAGVQWSSSIHTVNQDGSVRVYFHNLGPGPITFVNPAWSVKGDDIPFGTLTQIPLTPSDSSVGFSDGTWAGTFAEGVDIWGCVIFQDIEVRTGKHGTAHMDLSFTRSGELHTVRVNFHFK
jgi:hypothetical protein